MALKNLPFALFKWPMKVQRVFWPQGKVVFKQQCLQYNWHPFFVIFFCAFIIFVSIFFVKQQSILLEIKRNFSKYSFRINQTENWNLFLYFFIGDIKKRNKMAWRLLYKLAYFFLTNSWNNFHIIVFCSMMQYWFYCFLWFPI